MLIEEIKEKSQLHSLFSEAKKIAIYGAGKYGQLFLKELYNNKVYTKVFFVVSNDKTAECILGADVYTASEIDINKENVIVVIAGSKKNTDDILNNINCEKVTIFSDMFRSQLRDTELVNYKNDSVDSLEGVIKESYMKICYLQDKIERIECALSYLE